MLTISRIGKGTKIGRGQFSAGVIEYWSSGRRDSFGVALQRLRGEVEGKGKKVWTGKVRSWGREKERKLPDRCFEYGMLLPE